jgi:hypothetical protein
MEKPQVPHIFASSILFYFKLENKGILLKHKKFSENKEKSENFQKINKRNF